MARLVRRILLKIGKVLLIGGGGYSWYFASQQAFEELTTDSDFKSDPAWSAAILAVVAPVLIVVKAVVDPRDTIDGIKEDFERAKKNWRKFGVEKQPLSRAS